MEALTASAIERIAANKDASDDVFKPNVQVLNIKKINDKHRVIISDGKFMMPAVVPSSVDVSSMKENCVIQVTKHGAKEIKGKMYGILMGFDVVDSEQTEKLGDPKQMVKQVGDSKGEYTTPSPVANKVASKTQNAKEVKNVKRNLYCQPIASLNPYANSNWTIKARVTLKGRMNSWMKNGRSGKVFNVNLLDAHGGEIRATFYNDAADKFFPILEKENIYTFSKGRLKLANKMYSTLSNNYEIAFNEDAIIAPAEEDENETIGKATLNFRSIASLSQAAVKCIVNVVGVVTSYSEQRTIRTKNNNELQCRKITIADHSNASIDVALWGEKENVTDSILAEKPVIAITSCRVSDWDGRSLSTSQSTDIILNPEGKDADAVRTWNESGDKSQLKTLSEKKERSGSGEAKRLSVDEIEELVNSSSEPILFQTRASVVYINRNKDKPPYYTACPTCNKKVNGSDGAWMCEGCNKEYPNCEKRYLLRIAMADATGSQFINCFNKQGEQILGKTANEIGDLLATNEKEFDQVFKDAQFKEFKFICKAQQDEYQGQFRTRCIALRADEVDPETESENLLERIGKYLELESAKN